MLRKPLKGYEGVYDITSDGDVIRLEHIIHMPHGGTGIWKEHKLTPHVGTNGYLYVCLSKEGIHKTTSLHRAVAENFIPNPFGFPEVNHKDENKLNPCVDNLEWCDGKYNSSYGTGIKRRIEATEKVKKIDQFTLDGEFIKTWDSEVAFTKAHGIKGTGLILKVCKHYQGCTTAYGYKWKFHDSNEPLRNALPKGKQIHQYSLNGEYINTYDNSIEASKKTNVHCTCITRCARGVLKTANGYLWSYKRKVNYFENN